MSQETDYICSLGLEPIDVLGFSTEDELLEALNPLMKEMEDLEAQAA